ncbi:MAG TPA: hypothetical protein VGI48_18505 [Caldimonas sp.]|jgi:hypothetical protein
MPKLTWWQAALIGAVGGLALAVLKLIEARFFLTNATSVEAYAGYLTYFCYVLLGSLAAVFLADQDLPEPKVRRSAFVLGLLAPSVLLAIANQPVKSFEADRRQPSIPSLSWLPVSSAAAQEASQSASAAASSAAFKIEFLKSSALRPSFSSAFSAALGRGELREPYAYVVGSTPDKAKAISTAWQMQHLLSQTGLQSEQPRVVQVEGKGNYFVLVGDLGSKDDLDRLRLRATSSAIKGIDSSTSYVGLADRKKLAGLLVNAPVVPASALATEAK